ncbi:MAG: hypothetical protein Q9162_000152 [Coniocarpon cinnabarinum]
MASTNTAAWLNGARVHPFEVKESPYNSPEANEIVIQNATIAVNIIDYRMQDPAVFPVAYPAVIGQDVAGVVAAVGPGVTRFKKGDRVLGHAVSMLSQTPRHGAFQNYTCVPDNMASPIPHNLDFEHAVCVPLAASTASCGLYEADFLNLQRPIPTGAPKTGKTVLIWGGATSVGFSGIQLAEASGYETIVTASPKNHALLKGLGADHLIDYHSPSVSDEILSAANGKEIAGVLLLGAADKTWSDVCNLLVRHQKGGFIATAVHHDVNDVPQGVTAKFIFGLTLWKNDVGKALYENYLPEALAKGTFVAGPEPEIVGRGIGELQKAVDVRRNRDPSAKKMIVVV